MILPKRDNEIDWMRWLGITWCLIVVTTVVLIFIRFETAQPTTYQPTPEQVQNREWALEQLQKDISKATDLYKPASELLHRRLAEASSLYRLRIEEKEDK